MGFMDALGSAFSGVKNSATGSLGMVVDLAKMGASGGSDDQSRQQFMNDFHSAVGGAQAASSFVGDFTGLNAAGRTLDWTYSHLAARPVSTLLQQDYAVNPAYGGSGNVGDLFDPGKWKAAWNTSANLSPGQIAVAGEARGLDKVLPGDHVQQKLGIANLDNQNLWRAGAQGDQAFNPTFSLASGTVDAVAQFGIDPTIYAGKAAKAAKLAEVVRGGDAAAVTAESTAGLSRRQKSTKTGVDAFLETVNNHIDQVGPDRARGTLPTAMSSLRTSTQGPAIADLLVSAHGDQPLQRQVLSAAMGSTDALRALQATRADLAAKIDRAQQPLDSVSVLGARTVREDGQLTMASLLDGDEAKRAQAEIQADEKRLDLLNRAVGDSEDLAKANGANANPGIFNAMRMRPDANKLDQLRLNREATYFLQDGPLSAPVRVMRTLRTKRPGEVDLMDPNDAVTQARDFLRQVPGLPPEDANTLLGRVVAAKDKNARHIALEGVEAAGLRQMGAHYGVDPNNIESIINETIARRGQSMARSEERAYGAATNPATGRRVDIVQAEDGTFNGPRPLMSTQLADTFPMLDPNEVRQALWRNKYLGTTVNGAVNDTVMFFDGINDIWKSFALLGRGPAYMARNLADTSARSIAYMGGHNYATQLMARVAPQALKDKAATVDVGALRTKVQSDLSDAQVALEAARADRPLDVAVEQDPLVAQLNSEVQAHQAALESLNTFGQAPVQVGKYQFKGSMGSTPQEYSAAQNMVSAQDVWANLAATEHNRGLEAIRAGGWTTVTPESPTYADSFARVVNNHFRQDAVASRLLRGDAPSDVAAWLRSGEGRAQRRMMVHGSDTAERLVAANEMNINHFFGENDAFRQLAAEREITPADVRAAYPEGGTPGPAINAEQVAYSMGRGQAAGQLAKMRDWGFKWANTVPEDAFGRHPFYNHVYNQRLKEIVNALPEDATLSDAEQLAIHKQAQQFAATETKRILFDVHRKDNLAHAVRWVSPFMAAWEDSIVKYGRLIARDPSLIPKAWKVWTAPNRSSFVQTVDKNGNPIPPDKSHLTDNEYVLIPTPFARRFGFTQYALGKSSMQMVLQGDPVWMPGFGPLAAAPVNELAKSKPGLADSLSFMLPYGSKTSTLDLFLPSDLRNAKHSLSSPADDTQYAQSVVNIYNQMKVDEQTGKSKPMTDAQRSVEASKRAKDFWRLRAFVSATMPFSGTYKSPYQFYIDQAHAYRSDPKYKNTPGGWEQAFLQDYGDDYFRFATSLSKNNTGITSSKQAWDASRKYQDLIAENPELGWMVVGPDNTGAFDSNVRTSQLTQTVGPGSSTTYRGTYGPREAVAKNNAELGWVKYQEGMSQLDAALAARGLSSYNQVGAEQLAVLKKEFTASLMAENPDWADDFQARDDGKVRRGLQMMQQMVADKRLNGRNDVQAMAQYLQARQVMQAYLAQRAANGGSASLTAFANRDVANVWEQFNQYLSQQYVTYGDVYNRLLSKDDLTANVEVAA